MTVHQPVTNAIEVEPLLQNAHVTLEGRLLNAETQLAKLQLDYGRLLLRRMAPETENKLARVAMPSLAPSAAKHMTFGRLSKGTDKGVDKAAFEQVVQQHPGLKRGLKAFKELGTWAVHPLMAWPSAGGQKAVTSMLLQGLIDKEFCDGDPVKPDAEAVLACLTDLAQHLGEGLFLSTT